VPTLVATGLRLWLLLRLLATLAIENPSMARADWYACLAATAAEACCCSTWRPAYPRPLRLNSVSRTDVT
jgi:hypothetical protein